MNDIFILGAGLYAAPMIELAIACGYSPIGIFDKDETKAGSSILSVPILGSDRDIFKRNWVKGRTFAIAIGNNRVRLALFKKLQSAFAVVPDLIHPTACVSPSAIIGKGSYIQPHAIVWSKAIIGDAVIISPSTMISHHSSINDGSLISTLSSIGSDIAVGSNVFIGMGCTVITGIHTIVSDSIIGAGAVVTRDIIEPGTYVGIPAKRIK